MRCAACQADNTVRPSLLRAVRRAAGIEAVFADLDRVRRRI
jgi:hypothetical protein